MPAFLTTLLSTVAGKAAVGAVTLAAVTGVVATATDQDPEKVVVSTVADSDDSTTTTAGSTAESTDGTAAETTDDSTVDQAGAAAEDETVELESDAADAADAVEPKSNHGAAVSAAAQDHTQDEACGNHGRYVSSVARGEASCTPPPGQAKQDAAATESETETKAETETDSDTDDADTKAAPAPDAATTDQPASDNAKVESAPPVPPAPPAHAPAKGHKEDAAAQGS